MQRGPSYDAVLSCQTNELNLQLHAGSLKLLPCGLTMLISMEDSPCPAK